MKSLSLLILVYCVCETAFAQLDQFRGSTYSSIIGQNAEPNIYNEYNFNTYDLLNTNLQFSEKNSLQKVVFSPFKLGNNYWDVISETKINVSQKGGISTFGLALAYDNAAPFGKRANRLFMDNKVIKAPKFLSKNQFNDSLYANYDKCVWTLDAAYKDYVEVTYKLESKKAVHKYLRSLNYPSFKISFGVNTSLFQIIGGDEVDLDQNSLIDNKYSNKATDISGGTTLIFSEGLALNVGYHHTMKRATPEEGQEKATYNGFTIAIGGMIAKLDKNYKESDDYLLKLFIPSIILGGAFEFQKCTSNTEFCEDNIEQKWSFTPFIDFKISTKNQFRLGVPINSYKLVSNENLTDVGPFLQYTLQLSGK